MDKEELIKEWEEFALKNDYILNPNKKLVDSTAEKVLQNEKDQGMKFCPCRIRDGTKERDLKLVCPCEFEKHETWKKSEMCHCGLFLKKKE